MSKIIFKGIMPALITPLDAAGRVRADAVKSLMDHNYHAGVKGFYVAGGTGEGPLLTVAQRKAVAEAAVAANAGRGKIIIHTGSIHAEEVFELTRHAVEIGADGVSSVPPSFYFRYSTDETVAFYKRMAEAAADLPLLIYANQQTGIGNDINALLERLLPIPNICGVKDTRANYFAMWKLRQLNGGDINIINGPDESLLCGLIAGADGGIGSTYGAMPELFVALYDAFAAGDIAGARRVQDRINRIIQVILGWSCGNIIRPVKTLLQMNGFDAGNAIYPASEFTAEMRKRFREELMNAGYVFRG